jgi:diguanylate cyclase (GGDEF)-like protein
MRDILESCVRVDTLAKTAYEQMQRRCADPSVAEMCTVMAEEEAAHVQWWTELLETWDEGLLGDVWSMPETALGQLATTIQELERCVPAGDEPLDAETVLTTAAKIEFFALDPIFSELLDLAEPGVARVRHDAYAQHVSRLVEALDHTFTSDSLAGFLARILRRTEMENRKLSQYATMDALTGLGNRRALAAQAVQWTSWAARYGSALTFLMIDVDHFKNVNDAWGHATGDKVLIAIADVLRGSLRSADLVARYGGDEFVILAPELEPDDAHLVAGRLVAAIRSIRVDDGDDGDDGDVSVTASVGIATAFDSPDSQPRALDVMLSAADRSLYAAKNAGRDRAAEPVLLLHGLPLGE